MRHITLHKTSKAAAFHFVAAITFMLGAFVFSSCDDEDIEQSMALSGQWRGDFGMFYDYVDRHGTVYTFDSYDTRITFTPSYSRARYGRGTQVDYYDRGPYEYQYYKFSWSISNGSLYLDYDYEHQLDTRISNYHMTNDYFAGTFANSGTTFRLYKIADYYNWTPYVNAYGFGSRNDWDYGYPYYAPQTRSDVEAPGDSIQSEGKVLRMGRRSIPLKQ